MSFGEVRRLDECQSPDRADISVLQKKMSNMKLQEKPLFQNDRELFADFIQLLADFTLKQSKTVLRWKSFVDEKNTLTKAALEKVKEIVDVNIQNENGNTPLHLACSYGVLQIVHYLIIRGVRLDIANKNGKTPNLYVQDEMHNTILHYFLNQPIEDLADQLELQRQNLEICKKLLKVAPTLLNGGNLDGVTPLMYACENNDVECVKFLCDQPEIILEKRDAYNYSAANYAIRSKNPEIIESVLRKYPYPVDYINLESPIDRDGNTILHYAFKIPNLKIINQFINEKICHLRIVKADVFFCA